MTPQGTKLNSLGADALLRTLFVPGACYEVWTPINAFEAAAVLLRELEKGEADRPPAAH